jgi:hypothetical protein
MTLPGRFSREKQHKHHNTPTRQNCALALTRSACLHTAMWCRTALCRLMSCNAVLIFVSGRGPSCAFNSLRPQRFVSSGCPLKSAEPPLLACPNGRSGSRVTTEGLTICRNPQGRWSRRDGGTRRAPLRSTSDENRSVLSRSQPGRLRSYACPVRPLHSDADGGFRGLSGRGLTARGRCLWPPFLLRLGWLRSRSCLTCPVE